MEEQTVPPQLVGHAFVGQFYSILHQSPELLHRFYLDDSTMSRPSLDGSLTTVTTMKDINDLIMILDCKDWKVEIMNVDAQLSYKGGVTVLVTGCLTGKDDVRRKFTESFFLAPQSKGYYVLNDAFRFIDDDDCLPTVASVDVNESDENATATSAKEPEVSDIPKSLPNLNDAGDLDSKVEESVVVEPQVVVESSSEVPSEKKSYASIVKKKDGILTTPVHVTSAMKNSSKNNKHQSHGAKKFVPKPLANGSTLPAGQELKVAAVSTNAAESSAPNGNTEEHGKDIYDTKDKGYSVYIGNLPYNATVGDVEHEFKKFGPIKRDGIQVRCNKGFGFGFVEYESLSSVQKAIEASPIRIGDYEAFVHEKKTNTRVVNGVVTYPSGRGGYRSDWFRGRGNFSGDRGYGRNNYGRREGAYGNGAHSGDGYHRGYQNGGSRNLRQGAK